MAAPQPTPSPQGCPACSSLGTTRQREVPDHEYDLEAVVRYARCADCGSEYQSPMPGAEVLASFYPDGYHDFSGEGALQRIRNDMRARRLERFLDRDGAILDYGCGNGAFLDHLAARLPDRELWGFEIASEAQTIERANGRITIVKGSVDDLFAALPACRLVTMNHVIEHLPAPVEVLRELHAKLCPGGTLEGQTPAAGSTEQRVFGSYWSGYHAPRHTVIFSRAGLRSLFDHAGFDEMTLSSAFNPAGLAISLASTLHGHAPGRVEREGFRWLACLAVATLLTPIDLWLGPSAVVDFAARRVG